MRKCIALLVVAVVGAAAAPAAGQVAQAKLVNERVVIPGDRVFRDEMGATTVRLSPDGKHVVYIAMKLFKPPAGTPKQEELSKSLFSCVVVRDVESGKDTHLPMPATPMYEFLDIVLTGHVFDPTGKKIVVPAGVDANRDGRHDPKTEKLQAMVYDMATGKATKLGPVAQAVMPSFDRTGEHVLLVVQDRAAQGPRLYRVAVAGGKMQRLKVTGLPLPPCPTADVLVLAPLNPGVRKKARWSLYDLKADKIIGHVPRRRERTVLDPFRPCWTADGRYFCYPDAGDPKAAATRTGRECRAYDRIAKKEVAALGDLIPVGAGPGKSTVVLFRSPDRHKMPLVVYDVAAGKQWPLGDKSIVKALSTQGKYVVYAKASATRGINICAAEIVLPAAASRPAPVKRKAL